MDLAHEVNFDGLVGPTHSYAGLGVGNLASQSNRQSVSSPRAAALQGLAKMKRLADLGLRQGVLPPHERPDLGALRRLGFGGSDADVLWKARRDAPHLLAACSSASAMWSANAATVSPSADTADGRVHFTPANLISQLHRSLETETTARVLRAIFADPKRFKHHAPLPASATLGDEGAANHTRLTSEYERAGIELFVYGREGANRPSAGSVTAEPSRFPARQTHEASEAVARSHGLAPERTVFAQQHPRAVDAGVFHNDVIAVGNRGLLLCHEHAWLDWERVRPELCGKFQKATGGMLQIVEAKEAELPLGDLVRSYVFNSQLVQLPGGETILIAPTECEAFPTVLGYLARVQAEGGVTRVAFVDVRQSMRNGGGPACLRLRVVLTQEEQAAVAPGALLTDGLYESLVDWVRRQYRESLSPDDLADPLLLEEGRTALDELSRLLGLGILYRFQGA